MRYFFLKLGPGNSFAEPLLEQGVFARPMAVGFFRGVGLAEIEARLDDPKTRFSYQAKDLFRWSHGMSEGFAVVVALGQAWIVTPDGPMEEMAYETFTDRVGMEPPHKDDVPKLVPLRVIATEFLSHVPAILAQITSNRHYSSSTFKEITNDFGNQLAIDHLLFKRGLIDEYPSLADVPRDMYHLLLCLAPNELVTLIGRVLEEHGLLVPAATGGFVKNVDLFAYNDRAGAITIGGAAHGVMRVPPRRAFRHGAIALQIRRLGSDTVVSAPEEGALVIQLNAEPAERVLNHGWISAALAASPRSRAWLARVLRWVPFAGGVLQELAS